MAVVGDDFVDLSEVLGLSGRDAVVRAFADWEESQHRIEALLAGEPGAQQIIPADEAAIVAPLLYPAKVICAGANYYDHVEEMGITNIKERVTSPYFFLKPPTTTVVGPGQTIDYPVGSKAFDWEVELAVIIAGRAKGVPVDEALGIVGGYAMAIDLTARDLQLSAPDLFAMDWYAGKGQDTTCPLGPFITPANQVGDPQDLMLELSVNGTRKQYASTKGMVYTIAELISTASTYVTLEPGDVILTGSPAGVGAPSKDFLERGDKLVASSPGLGRLEVQVRS